MPGEDDRMSGGERRRSRGRMVAGIASGLADPQAILSAVERHGERRREDGETPYVAPEGEVQERLAQIWRSVLAVDRIGAGDDFFRLGGQSLLATQMLARVRSAFGGEPTLRDLIAAPTLGAFADRLAQSEGSAPGAGIAVRDRGQPLPLSFAQLQQWLLVRLDPQSPAFNLPNAVRLTGPLSLEALLGGLRTVVGRHEVLRTRFRFVEEEPQQIVSEEVRVPVTLVDLGALAPQDLEREAEKAVEAAAARLFDLEQGPLLRVSLDPADARGPRRGADDAPHISDAWSHDLLIGELAACYGATLAGSEPELPALVVQYGDFAAWQRERLDGEALAPRSSIGGGACGALRRSSTCRSTTPDRRPSRDGARGFRWRWERTS